MSTVSKAFDMLPERWFEDIPAGDTSVQRCCVFRTVPGVVYQVETSHDLETWTSDPEIYGLGHEHVVPLLELIPPPPPDPQNPVAPLIPFQSVGLRVEVESGTTDGIILSWPSLDHGGPMIHKITGSLHQDWENVPLFAERFDDFFFFIFHPAIPAPGAGHPDK
jgi:hypothetical protein